MNASSHNVQPMGKQELTFFEGRHALERDPKQVRVCEFCWVGEHGDVPVREEQASEDAILMRTRLR